MSIQSRLNDAMTALMRTDAAVDANTGAAISNAISGLGGIRDAGAMARPDVSRSYLTEEELVALMRGTVYRRVVELKPRWATQKGWAITDDTDDERPLFDELRRLKVRRAVRRADIWGRALGESRILLVTEDGADWSESLIPENVRAVKGLQVLDRREFSPHSYNGDLGAGELGEPQLYHVTPQRPGVGRIGAVHRTRLLRFYGDDLPPSEIGYNSTAYSSWGADAIGQMLWDGIRNLSQTGAGGAKIAQELSIAVFKFASARSKSGGDERSDFLSKLSNLVKMKSLVNAIFLGKDDDFQRVATTPSGFKDLSEHAKMELGLLTGYPLVLLLGEAPGGLNTDGDSWKANWFADVLAHQEDRYREPLEFLVRCLYAANGGIPDEWSVDFTPLGELTKLELAELRERHTRADSDLLLAGALTQDEVRSRYTQPGGFRDELQLQERPATRTDARPAQSTCIMLPLPATAVERLAELWEAAGEIGQLDVDGEPHMTALYLGDVADEDLEEVIAVLEEVAAVTPPLRVHPRGVDVFDADPAPVVLGVESWGAGDLRGALLQRLAHLVSQRQHDRYRPHVTIGYAAELSLEDRGTLLDLEVPDEAITLGTIGVWRGGELVGAWALSGRSDEVE